MTTLVPITDHIIVRLDAAETTLSSGIVLVDSLTPESDRATVLAVGPDIKDAIKAGDRVLLVANSGLNVEVNKEKLKVVKTMNIIGVMPDTVDTAADIEVIGTNVVFQFLDEIGGPKRMFTDRKSAGGIIVTAQRAEQREPRWGVALAVGPDSVVTPGEYILIEGSMWTRDTRVAGESVWKTEDQHIMAVTDDPDDCLP